MNKFYLIIFIKKIHENKIHEIFFINIKKLRYEFQGQNGL